MNQIELIQIDRTNLTKVLKLEIHASETDFVAPNSISISEAYVESGLHPRAIELNKQVVGFIMYGHWENEESYWITRLMIDKNFRNRGYAKEAFKLAINALFALDDCSKISISFEPENTTAQKLYTSLGFTDTRKLIEGELLFELEKLT